jgi:hypothetical protein
MSESDRRYHWNLRVSAIEAYGGKCEHCGITNVQYLTIDHIDDNGGEHRKELFGSSRQGGHTFYSWLKKNGYPPGYRVLCWNHNASRQNHPEICEEPYKYE